jgi:hypothetical protein
MKKSENKTEGQPQVGSDAGLGGWVVQRWSQYKLGRAPFSHDTYADHKCDSKEDAERYALTADGGYGGDMRYRYTVVPPPNDEMTNPQIKGENHG